MNMCVYFSLGFYGCVCIGRRVFVCGYGYIVGGSLNILSTGLFV